jgi:hypothetical protein
MRWSFLCLALLCACNAETAPRDPGGATPSLLAALGIAEGLQHQADELEALGDLPGAIDAVEGVLSVTFPEDGTDREDVRLDAYGRIAELELARGDLEAARAAIERGRAEASRDGYFHARLLLALGRVQQARAAALRDGGDEGGARAASLEAVATLEESIAMNQRVLALLSRLPSENAP